MERSGIILAGGKSSRMGSPKYLLRVGAVTVVERIVEELQPELNKLVVVAAYGSGAAGMPESLSSRSISIIRDELEDTGPLAGISAGFKHMPGETVLVAAADMPFPSRLLARRLFAECEQPGVQAVLPEFEGRRHPLFAVYRRSALESLTAYLQSGGRKVMEWLAPLKTVIVQEADIRSIDPDGLALFNMNTPEDYKKACSDLRTSLGRRYDEEKERR